MLWLAVMLGVGVLWFGADFLVECFLVVAYGCLRSLLVLGVLGVLGV